MDRRIPGDEMTTAVEHSSSRLPVQRIYGRQGSPSAVNHGDNHVRGAF